MNAKNASVKKVSLPSTATEAAVAVVANDLGKLAGIPGFDLRKCTYKKLLALAISRWPELETELADASSVTELRERLVRAVRIHYLEQNQIFALASLVLAKGWEHVARLSEAGKENLLELQSSLDETGLTTDFLKGFAARAKPLIRELLLILPEWPAYLLPENNRDAVLELPENWQDLPLAFKSKTARISLVFWLPDGSQLGGKSMAGLQPARLLGVRINTKTAQAGKKLGRLLVRLPAALQYGREEVYPLGSELLIEFGWR